MTTVELLTCELCGLYGSDVAIGLAWYREADPSQQVQPIARCLDVDACRSRVEQRGEQWPLRERSEA